MERLIKWDITGNCNLNCLHCYNREYYNNKRNINILNIDNIDHLIWDLKSLRMFV